MIYIYSIVLKILLFEYIYNNCRIIEFFNIVFKNNGCMVNKIWSLSVNKFILLIDLLCVCSFYID